MSLPPVDALAEELKSRPIRDIVRDRIFGGTPYVFRARPSSADTLYDYVAKQFAISRDCVKIVGSAKVGFSLSPDNFPRRFTPKSDIDVVVVDEKMFDTVWMALLDWHYPRRSSGLARPDAEWAKHRRREVYWGWFVPADIRFEGLSFPESLNPVRELRTRWFNVFQSLSIFPEFSSRTVSGRLYRTWNFAYAYHAAGLNLVKEITSRSK